MTINSVQTQEPNIAEKPPITVQNDINKGLNKEITEQTKGQKGTQNQVLQLLATTPPPLQQVHQTAQNQIKKGGLDVKV